MYNILPYIEQQALHDMGAGLSYGDAPGVAPNRSSAKCLANCQRMTVPISMLNCPTRRPAIAYPFTRNWAFMNAADPDAWRRSPITHERRGHVHRSGHRRSVLGLRPRL